MNMHPIMVHNLLAYTWDIFICSLLGTSGTTPFCLVLPLYSYHHLCLGHNTRSSQSPQSMVNGLFIIVLICIVHIV
jgi:hypothetical protein